MTDGLDAARREATKVGRRYRLRRVVGRQGMYDVLECHHRMPKQTSDIGDVEPRGSRRCRQCPTPSQVCRCSPDLSCPGAEWHQPHPTVHWKDEHRPGCARCGCHAFKAQRLDLT